MCISCFPYTIFMHPVFQIMILQLRRISTHTVVSEITNGDIFFRTNVLDVLNSIVLS